MTKKDIYDNAIVILTKYEASPELTAELTELLKPKSGGPVVDLDAVTKRDDEGNIVELECSTSGVFLPATEEYFYKDKTGKGPNGLKRNSRQADKIKKAFEKKIQTSERNIMDDVLNAVLTPEEGKAKVEELRKQTPDYSSVGPIKPEVEEQEETESQDEAEAED